MDTFEPEALAWASSAQLGQRLRLARRLAGLSQAALAARVGVRASAVAQWEQAAGTQPRIAHLVRVACICAISFEWLATGRGPMWLDATAPSPLASPAEPVDAIEQRLLQSFRRLRPRKRAHFVRWLEGIV